MKNIYFCSDHHLSHNNIIKFLRKDGSRLREFNSIDEHDEYIIQQHNNTILNEDDLVYFLGDVANKYSIDMLHVMNGRKILIKGNHDTLDTLEYLDYFEEVHGSYEVDKMLLTHIPVHPNHIGRWKCNIHGHLHDEKVKTSFGFIDDKRYLNVSLECLKDYKPISLDEVKETLKNRDLKV